MFKYFKLAILIILLTVFAGFGEESDSTVNKVKNELVFVKGGTFQMGSNAITVNKVKTPIHLVTVNDFYISKYELTQSKWGQHMPALYYNFGEGPNYPVYYVSWYETLVYCNKRSIAEGF
ncbi:MAG: SUMF1/EgtB/PvdO family nonheme iron enzyme [Candidatus Delongbacteria bacterium]|jgi:sulfatase modifying factor 1|nr:SUMF1/EgtB/PvdO family nonheme iron enzyme [Candidatus Delongbacteria bacterium]